MKSNNTKTLLPASFIRSQNDKLSEDLERLKKKKAGIKNFPDFGSSTDDAAQEVAEFSNENEILKKIDYSVKEIKQALKAIENGTYGVCQVCGENIMLSRLKIMPEATTCAEDQKRR